MIQKHSKSIRRDILLPVIFLGIVAVLSSLLALMSINKVKDTAIKISDQYMKSVEVLGDIKSEAKNMHKLALSHMISLDLPSMLVLTQEIKASSRMLESNIREYERYVAKGDEDVFNQLLESHTTFEDDIAHLIALSVYGKTTLAYSYANNELEAVTNHIEELITTLVDHNRSEADTAKVSLLTTYWYAIIINALTILTALSSSIVVIRMVSRKVITPIIGMEQELSLMITEITNREGDLTKRVDVQSEDEIGSLGQGINTFIEKLQNIFGILRKDTNEMEVVVNDVFESVHTSNEGTAALSAMTEEISATMEQVSNHLKTVYKNSMAMHNDVTSISDESSELDNYSKEMKQNAEKIKLTASNNVNAISEKVNEILMVLNEAIADSKSVDQVNTLTDDILNISSQTNLLALNASIEAARAGEAGKGFAVVAEEIRLLADSSREIANNIQEINRVVTHAVYNLSNHAKELTGYLTDSILPEFNTFIKVGEQYMKDAEYIESSMTSFKHSTDELMDVMQGMGKSIETIGGSIEESAQGINGVANHVQELVEDMNTITMRMDQNKAIALELKQESEVFKNL